MFGDKRNSDKIDRRWVWGAWGALVIALLVAIMFLIQILADLDRAAKQRDTNRDYLYWVVSQFDVNLRRMDTAIDVTKQPRIAWFGYKQLREDFAGMKALLDRIAGEDGGGVPANLESINRLISLETQFVETYAPVLELPDVEVAPRLPQMQADLQELIKARWQMLEQTTRFSDDTVRDEFDIVLERTRNSGSIALLILAALLMLNVFLLLLLRNKDQAIAQVMGNMESIIRASPDAVFLTSQDLDIIGVAPATQKMFGFEEDEARGRQVFDYFANDRSEVEQISRIMHDLATEPDQSVAHRAELNGQRANGETFPAGVRFTAMHDGSGRLVYVILVSDLTEQADRELKLMEARNEALQAERAKSRFLSAMSHEMRTPLNGVLASLDLMRETTELSDRQRELVGIIERCGDDALEQVENVLELTRLDTMANTAINLAPFSPSEVLRDIVEANQTRARTNGNTLRYETLVPDNLFVSGSAILFRQIMHNFISNATKFTVNGEVKIALSSRELAGSGEIELTAKVVDTGIGILEEDLERIFRNFETIRDSYSHFKSGTGLGLSIAKNSADLMGGRIEVESEPGQGSCFALVVNCATVDMEKAAGHPAGLEQRKVEGRNQMDVLVVEDNEINRRMLVDMLQAKGHLVTEATDGLEGVSVGREREFDLILMDISMPKLDGVGATRMLRQFGKSRHSPIVAVTAHSQPEHMREFLEAGMDRVLTKPLRMSTLEQLFSEMGHQAPEQAGTAATEEEEEPMAEDLIEKDVFDGLIDMLGGESVAGYVTQFEADVDTMLPRYQQAIASEDFATARAEAHRCAGGAAVIGASKVHGMLQDMTHSADAKDTAKCQTLIDGLPKQVADTMTTMRRLIAAQ